MKQAVHFGAGNIGRGFLGQLYFQSGYYTTFLDVAQDVVASLHERHEYPLRIVEDAGNHDLLIQNVDAVMATDLEAAAARVAAADFASTAVGVNVLPHIARNLARGLQRRLEEERGPLDIIVCENMVGAGAHLRKLVLEHLPADLHHESEKKIGFIDASIGRMVPAMTAEQKAEDPLLVCVEPYCELPVDVDGFRAGIPEIAHLHPKAQFHAYVERKLYVHNMAHAATAYLGYLRGHEFIWQAIEDSVVREEVDAAAWESCRALASKYNQSLEELDAHRRDLLRRFANRALADQVSRVARDPLRKLGPSDRFIGAALLAESQGVHPHHIAHAAAAALFYDNFDDTSALQLQEVLARNGIEGVLREVCHLDPETALGRAISQEHEAIAAAINR